MDWVSLQIGMLAESNIWSELFSVILFLLVVAIPAISNAIAQRNKSSSGERIEAEGEKRRTVLSSGIPREKRRNEGKLSEWDRRQQQIKDRLGKLKESPQVMSAHKRTEPARPVETVSDESLPLAMPIAEKEPAAVPPPMPVRPLSQEKPTVAAKQISFAAPAKISGIVEYKTPVKADLKKPKVSQPGKKAVLRQNSSVIERILRSMGPLKSGIILKEILDKPAALKRFQDPY